MKKLILIAGLILLTVAMPAQNLISFGPKVGWNSNRLSKDYKDYLQDMKSGFQAGLFFSLNLDKFYVQPEGYFSIKRGIFESSIDDPFNPTGSLNVSQTVTLQTVDVPLLLGFKVLDLKLARLRIWGGPVASYVLDKQYTLSIDGIDQSDRISGDDFKDATWSVQFGAGLDLLMLTLDVGYDLGLDNFMTIRSLDDLSLKNNVFFCSLGWRIY
jgi:hypothetical protein